jgi:archaeal flagellar protein FlaI
MPEEKRGSCNYEVEIEGEERVLKINCAECTRVPSIEDNPICMAATIEKLAQAGTITRIVFSQKRDYEYEYDQTQLLVEIAKIYKLLMKQKDLFSYQRLNFEKCAKCVNARYNEIQEIIFHLLKEDPIGAYVELKRLVRKENIIQEKTVDQRCINCQNKYIMLLNGIMRLLEDTKLITVAKPYVAGYKIGDRSVYSRIFSPIIKPDFMYTKLMAAYPKNGQEIANFTIGEETEVTIFRLPDSTQVLYHIMPPEFKLSEEKYEILDTARKIMAEHKPKKSEFVDPQRMRDVFFNVGKDLIDELSTYKGIKFNDEELIQLTKILVRYTVGFGLIEVLLQDEDLQDISVNSPMGQTPIFIVHGKYDDCYTNIIPTKTEAESWASKLRLVSGRPLDEANPILDTELELPGASTRVAAINSPLDPSGLAFSFRRHRDKPWTLPLFIKQKMITPLAAGLISFMVDGTRTFLIAGTRSSGKTSFLGAVMVEIMRRYRIITIEDTLELPSSSMRKLGYNIQSLKVGSSLAHTGSEVSASIGIRSTLRLGDSSLIIGEVRSDEAKSLYEAMRVGAAANVVAGTIHGDSPYGVFDRVVNDIGVPKTSFKATDIIIVANPIKTADGLHRNRRVTQITEVRKEWEDDPLTEKGFVDLMKYNPINDQLEPTDELVNGESDILKSIANNVPEFAGNWEAMWENITLRAKIKEAIVNYSEKEKNPELLEAPFVIKCNDQFHLISEKTKQKKGRLDSKDIFFEFDEWIKKEIRKIKLNSGEK